MGMYRIQVVNRDFSVCNEVDLPDMKAARTQALRGALDIGSEEVCNGASFFGTEVIIEGDGAERGRMVIAIGASPLQ
jgi:hypothetical protein